jgi:hypothetical protein|tara:strand:+ start:207 stop:533 length:327 start_codon:yes stop_codon:yes gene_type:complete
MTIQLENNIENSSLQIGDYAYYVSLVNGYGDTPISIGKITEIGINSITIDPNSNAAGLSVTDFVMFSKDTRVNNNSLLGYYAEVKLTNNSIKKAELFSLGSEVLESSK